MGNRNGSTRNNVSQRAGSKNRSGRLHERLQLTEENYKTIFENSAVAITVTDGNENIVSWNRYAEVVLGMDGNDLYMKPVKSLYPEEEWKRIRSQNVRKKGMQHHIETTVIGKDGKTIDVDLSLTVLKGPDGEVTGSIGIMLDITERKLAEEALRQSEAMSRGMIETAATGIYLLDEGRFVYVNRRLEEISGYTADELIGMRAIDYIHPGDRERVRGKSLESLKGNSSLPYEFRAIRKDLETIWVSERVTSIEYGCNHAILGTLMDVTERKLAEIASQEHTNRIETLLSIGSTVGQTLNLTDLLEKILEKVLEVIRTGVGGIFLVDKGTDDLVLTACRGFSDSFAHQVARMKIGKGFAGRAALSGKPVIVGNMSADLRFDPVVLESEGLQSLCSMPVMVKEKIMGVICVGSHDSRDFRERDVRLLDSIATQIGVAIENAQLYEQTVEIAFTDELTGLYNRRYLMEQVEREFARALRRRTTLSLIMIDMDGLKTINDRFGHQHGSAFLKQLGAIIKGNIRASDVAARLGGDEFMIMAPDTDSVEAGEIGERLRAETQAYRVEINGWEVGMSVSIGIASYPVYASDVEGLLKQSDGAMYEAKRAGKNRICLATPPAPSKTGITVDD